MKSPTCLSEKVNNSFCAQKVLVGLFLMALATDQAFAMLAVPASNSSADDSKSPTSTLSDASVSFSDQLNLVTTNIFSGGIALWKARPNVLISSTLAASKPTSGTATKYQDTEMLIPHGGVLNLFFSSSSVDVDNVLVLAKTVKQKGQGTLGREALADRRYLDAFSGETEKKMTDIVLDKAARIYFPNGIGVRLLNRNADSTTSKDVSNYGLSELVYFGIGADGAFIPPKEDGADEGVAGNYRLEVMVEASSCDPVTIKTLYPNAVNPKAVNFGVTANLQIAIAQKLSVNIQAGWPIGSSNKYVDKVLLAGITISR